MAEAIPRQNPRLPFPAVAYPEIRDRRRCEVYLSSAQVGDGLGGELPGVTTFGLAEILHSLVELKAVVERQVARIEWLPLNVAEPPHLLLHH